MVTEEINSGWKLLKHSLRVVVRHPLLALPIFFSWAVCASLTIYSKYYLDWPDDFLLAIGILFLMVFVLTTSLSLSCIMLFEFIEQIESGRRISFLRAMREAFIEDLWKVLPLSLLWAGLWTILLILKALTSKAGSGEKGENISARGVAKTLSGLNNNPFSFLRMGIYMAEKMIRMLLFLSLPAIAWENLGPFRAFSRAVKVAREHPVTFLSSYCLTELAGMIMFLPLVFLLIFLKAEIEMADWFWAVVILYEGIAWTLFVYLEQMSMGLQYLWYMKWKREVGRGSLRQVTKPDLLDEVHEFGNDTQPGGAGNA